MPCGSRRLRAICRASGSSARVRNCGDSASNGATIEAAAIDCTVTAIPRLKAIRPAVLGDDPDPVAGDIADIAEMVRDGALGMITYPDLTVGT